MKPKISTNGFDDDPTPVERKKPSRNHIVIPPLPPPPAVVQPFIRTDPPELKIAHVWKTTIVTAFALVVIGVLAALQSWPYEIALGAIGTLTGLWTFGAIVGRR